MGDSRDERRESVWVHGPGAACTGQEWQAALPAAQNVVLQGAAAQRGGLINASATPQNWTGEIQRALDAQIVGACQGVGVLARQSGDQVADMDGLAAEAMDRRMYGHSFTLNGERVDPLRVSVGAEAQRRECGCPLWAHGPGAACMGWTVDAAGAAAMFARIAELEAENAKLRAALPQPVTLAQQQRSNEAQRVAFPARALRFSR